MSGTDPNNCVLTGNSDHTIDAKSRIAVPSGFRSKLPEEYQKKYVLKPGKDNSIEIHPAHVWKRDYLPEILKLNNNIKRERQKRRAWLAFCFEIEADTAFRVIIPKSLMDYAGLVPGQQCVVTTAGEYLELMRTSSFSELKDTILNRYTEITDEDEGQTEPAATKEPEPGGNVDGQ